MCVSDQLRVVGSLRQWLLTGCAGATKSQCEDAHGDDTATLSAVDVGVTGKDVGDRLRCVRLESHCDSVVRVVVVDGWLAQGVSSFGRIECSETQTMQTADGAE